MDWAPYWASRLLVKAMTMVIANWVIKLLRPKTTMLPQVFPLGRKASARRWTVLNRGIYATDTTNEATWPITVAMAAPRTPISKTKINTASRMTFSTAPMIMENMAYLGLPSARIMELMAPEIIIKGRPMPITQPYSRV